MASPSDPTRVLIVDDQDMIRDALCAYLRGAFGYEVDQVRSGAHACATVRTNAPDVVLLDIEMPEMNGLETLRKLRALAPDLPVVMLSSFDDEAEVRAALDLGARGYIVKGARAEQLREAIDTAISGAGVYLHPDVTARLLAAPREARESLSDRERAVMEHLMTGSTNEQIAQALFIAEKTVKSHLSSAFRKLAVSNRTEAAVRMLRDDGPPAGRRPRRYHLPDR